MMEPPALGSTRRVQGAQDLSGRSAERRRKRGLGRRSSVGMQAPRSIGGRHTAGRAVRDTLRPFQPPANTGLASLRAARTRPERCGCGTGRAVDELREVLAGNEVTAGASR